VDPLNQSHMRAAGLHHGVTSALHALPLASAGHGMVFAFDSGRENASSEGSSSTSIAAAYPAAHRASMSSGGFTDASTEIDPRASPGTSRQACVIGSDRQAQPMCWSPREVVPATATGYGLDMLVRAGSRVRESKADGTGFGACVGQVVPTAEVCANGIDEDCNGVVDDAMGSDGDGWTRCNGDCCDSTSSKCPSPKLVNPGAIDVAGDGIDNDCDGTVDNAPTTVCSTAAKFTSVTGSDVARAMDVCQTTTANPPIARKKWGLIHADLPLADGTLPTGTALTDLQNKQTALTTLFGNTVGPKKNQTMAIISSAMARDANESGLGHADQRDLAKLASTIARTHQAAASTIEPAARASTPSELFDKPRS
jgi:Putative metal-binding motif